MTKQQLLEAIRRVIKQELAEEIKTKSIPNPNAGKWRILNSKTESPLTDKFYDTKEEAGKAAKALGQINAPGIKIVQLKDTMKTFTKENAPAPSKPKETPNPVVEPGNPGQKPGTRRPFKKPNVKPKRKATIEEAEMLAKVIKRFKSKREMNEAGKTWAEGYNEGYNEGFKDATQGKSNKFKK
jgi:hypothetical protein